MDPNSIIGVEVAVKLITGEFMIGDKQKMFAKATKVARGKLGKKKCLDVIGSAAVATLDNSQWKEELFPDGASAGGYLPATVAAVADPATQTVTVNVLGGFFVPTREVGGITVDYLGELRDLVPTANDDDLRAFVMLHEISHLTGALGPDRNDPEASRAINKKIAANCF